MNKERKLIIAGNWKMNKTISEATELVNDLKRDLAKITEVDVVVAPSFVALKAVSDLITNTNIKLAAQDVHWAPNGAFTGEVSVGMLRDVYVHYVIIGHSERRQYFGETNESVNKKLKAALTGRLTPIVCVGETLAEREAGRMESVIRDHVTNGLAGLTNREILDSIIAYEPVWAIGTGKTATPAQAQEVHALIRKVLTEIHGAEVAKKVRIQYGGSVKSNNAFELLSQPDIDGALVGGASLEAREFTEIVKQGLK